MTQETQEVVASYITDMLALEEHLQKAFAGQLADLKDSPYASTLRDLTSTSEAHARALHALAERREQGGQGIAEVVKKAASSVLGMGAAALDFVRSEKTPKNLRDDYAAVSLANVGYLMLHTTAMTLHDAEAASLAHAHLRDYAKASMTLFHLIPGSVVDFLKDEGFPIDDTVTAKLDASTKDVWR
ncbi:MAG: hypothetical protein KA154_17990 [Gemmatimonadaceae bacterium]|nr:hypothetical protein [Gemmatimonadaceae bacterium]